MRIYRYYYVKGSDSRRFCGIIRANDSVHAHDLAKEWLKNDEYLMDIEPLEGISEVEIGIKPLTNRVYKIYYLLEGSDHVRCDIHIGLNSSISLDNFYAIMNQNNLSPLVTEVEYFENETT